MLNQKINMDQIDLKNDEDKKQLAFLSTKIGVKGSGYTRYSAAMYFYNGNVISSEYLEVFRICCKLDHEDPWKVAEHEGL